MDSNPGKFPIRACIAIFVIVGLALCALTGNWGIISAIVGGGSIIACLGYYFIYYPPTRGRRRER
jgi:hypothetical protein